MTFYIMYILYILCNDACNGKSSNHSNITKEVKLK